MSKLLLKLVDEAIVPSMLLVAARIGGLVTAILALELEYRISDAPDSLFPYKLTFETISEATQANSLSTGLMVCTAFLGAVYALYKVMRLQDRRLSPRQLLNLAEKNLLRLIEQSKSVYIKSIVWIMFLWVTTILAVSGAFSQLVYIWIAVFSVIMSILSTLLLVKNFEIDYTEEEPVTSSLEQS